MSFLIHWLQKKANPKYVLRKTYPKDLCNLLELVKVADYYGVVHIKQELYEEQKNYREYLRQELEEQKLRDKELDRIVNEEVEKQFQKRLAQWKAEKKARKDLLEKVIQGRQMQINQKCNDFIFKRIIAL